MDFGNALALDSRGYVYLTGTTYSNNFYLKKPWYRYGGGALQGTTDAFVAKFNPVSYIGLEYSTYLGGSGNDSGLGIALDSANNLFLTGTTTSGNFPTRNPLVDYWAGGDLFVTKVGVEIPRTAPYFNALTLSPNDARRPNPGTGSRKGGSPQASCPSCKLRWGRGKARPHPLIPSPLEGRGSG